MKKLASVIAQDLHGQLTAYMTCHLASVLSKTLFETVPVLDHPKLKGESFSERDISQHLN